MRIAIIGSGPAGLSLATFLAQASNTHPDISVDIFERGPVLGQKLRATGGGRMNVTNRNLDISHFRSFSPRLLSHFFKTHWITDRFSILKELGIKYIYEKDRAILASMNANLEVERYASLLSDCPSVTIHTHSEVSELRNHSSDEGTSSWLLAANDTEHSFDRVIVATGAMNRFGAPSSPSGIYGLLLDLGLTVTDVAPVLSPLRIPYWPLACFSGISFSGSLSTKAGSTVSDDILITHAGLSGPAVLDFSASHTSGDPLILSFLPLARKDDFISEFTRLRQGSHRLDAFLRNHLPKRLALWHIERSHLAPDMIIADISKDCFTPLLTSLFDYSISEATTFDYPMCWTTKGGIELKHVNMGTLEVKKLPGLYLAGEVLDIDGLCGGYNISFAFICGKIISEHLLSQLP